MDENDNCLLKSWEEKPNKQYKVACDVWSVKDVNKFCTAKENKLNYICIYCQLEKIDIKLRELLETLKRDNQQPSIIIFDNEGSTTIENIV